MSKRPASGDAPEKTGSEKLVIAAKKIWEAFNGKSPYHVLFSTLPCLITDCRSRGSGPQINKTITDILNSPEFLKEKGWLILGPSKDGHAKYVITFCEWFTRLVIAIYGSIEPDFEDPSRICKALEPLLGLMKVDWKPKCAYFSQQFGNVLLSVCRGDLAANTNELLKHHLRAMPGVFPEIPLDMKSDTKESLIIGLAKLLVFLRCECNTPYLLDEELNGIFSLLFNPRQDVRLAIVELFVTSFGCTIWSCNKIEHFVEDKFGPLINLDTGAIISRSTEYHAFVEVLVAIIQLTQSQMWIEVFLFLLIRVVWKAEPDVCSAIKGVIQHIGQLFHASTGFKMFRKHTKYLLPKLIHKLIEEEDNFESHDPVGKMLRKAFELFDLKQIEIETHLLPLMLIDVLLIGRKPAQDVFIDIMNEFDEIDFKRCVDYFPALVRELIDNLKIPSIEEAMSFLKSKLWSNVWSHLFSNSRVITEVLLNYSHNKENVFYFIEQFVAVKSVPTFKLKFEATENFLANFVNAYDMMTCIVLEINERIAQEQTDRILKHERAVLSLISLTKVVKTKGVTRIQTTLGSLLKQLIQLDNLAPTEYELIAKLYYVFIDNLGKQDLEMNADHLCKDLVLILEDAETVAVEALKLIILDKGLSDDTLSKILFIPLNWPALEPVYTRIDHAIEMLKEKLKDDIAVKVIKLSDEAINTDETDMKQLRLERLRDFIKANYQEQTSVGDFTSSWMVKVYSNLISDSRLPDKVIRRVVAECMGHIGAIDPSRFDQIPFSSSEAEITNFDVQSNEFGAQLIGRLLESVAKMTTGNVFEVQLAYFITIRDLKAVFNPSQFHFAVNQVPNKYRSLLSEAVESKANGDYQVFHEIRDLRDGQIFTKEINYEEWLRKWAKKMIMLLSVTSKERQIFEKCAVLFNSDYRLAEMLVPCIVYHFLCSSNVTDGDRSRLVDREIHSIINSAIPREAGMGTFEASSPLESRITVSAVSLNQTQHACAQQVFALFDSLSRKNGHEKIKKSLDKMSFIHLAHLAYGCQSYSRSLLYLEQHVYARLKSEAKFRLKIELVENEIHLLQKIYVALDDPDGVEGVSMSRKTEPNIMDRILAHEATNHLDDALACCEKGVQSNPDHVDYSKMMLRCLLSMDQPSTAYKYSLGTLAENPDWNSKIKPYMIEATWKLGKWDKLDALTRSDGDSDDGNTSFVIGQILTCIKRKDTANLKHLLDKARVKEMNPISAMASQRAAYLRSYQHLVRLHMFGDLERASSCLFGLRITQDEPSTQSLQDLNILLDLRNDSILQSLQTLEPVLSLQRVLYDLARAQKQDSHEFSQELATSWLLSAKIARKSGNVQRAYHCLLETQERLETSEASCNLNLVSNFLVETSKHGCLRRDPDSKEKALRELNRGISKHFDKYLVPSVPGSPQRVSPHNIENAYIRSYSKAKLLSIRMTDEIENTEKRDVVSMYSKLVEIDTNWEKPHFYLAKLHDRIAAAENMDGGERIKNQNYACLYYSNSLKQGCKYSQESLPRLLEIYFEMSSSIKELLPLKGQPRMSDPEKQLFDSTSGYVEALASCVPSYVLYTAFSQIMSRFNHSSEKVCSVLTILMESLVSKYPKQMMWRLMVFAFMPKDEKAYKYQSVLLKITKNSIDLYKKMRTVTEALIELSGHKIEESEGDLPSRLTIFKVFTKAMDCPILVPSGRFMRVTLPASGLNEESHEAFDPNHVFITGINRKVHVLSSLARPKRISFFTSCGANFNMMIKPKDDLRVDNRTLEFCDFINRLLKKDPETRKRRLSIRTFQVIPLSYDHGLVEWVDGLKDIRSILLESYEKYRGVKRPGPRENYPGKGCSSSSALRRFRDQVLPCYSPPVFREWFLEAFPDATSWQLARINYVRSTAVMCMVGYIIGLGDRHLENILLDQASGEIVHVDFNCLFNRGEKLEVPEVVPFRLTQNVVDAMGLTGYEGHFRRTCEETLRVVRANRDMLMSVLNPFVFDPFVGADQPKQVSRGKSLGKKSNVPENMINEDVSIFAPLFIHFFDLFIRSPKGALN